MSTILIRRSIAVSAEEAGREFANASMDVQAEFLKWFAAGVREATPPHEFAPWSVRCSYIADELSDAERAEIAGLLETLVEHLREPVEQDDSGLCVACYQPAVHVDGEGIQYCADHYRSMK